jgi:polyisoprenoid-binding protein YceI
MKRVVKVGFGAALVIAVAVLVAWSAGSGDHDGLKRPILDPGRAPAGEGDGDGGEEMSYRIDTRDSWVVAVTETAGALGFLGHRHSVLVTDWTAEIDWRPKEPGTSRATVTVPARSLRIDTTRGRELAGLDEGPSADDVVELQEKMLSAENLAAAQHPELRFEVTGVERSGTGDLEVEGRLTVRGQARTVRFPVKVEPGRAGDTTYFSGGFTVNQTDFGIEPESIAGVVKVADPVEIRFRIAVRR